MGKLCNDIKCEVCGAPNSTLYRKSGQYLCMKHYKQAYRKDAREKNKNEGITADSIIKMGIPKSNIRGPLTSENRFYEFPDENILAIKHYNDIFITDLDKKELLDYKTWYANNEGYPVCSVEYKGRPYLVRMPRLLEHCTDPDKVVDHKNGNVKDNRSVNLRECTAQENCFNKNTVGNADVKGVTEYKLKNGNMSYMARIKKDGKQISKNFDNYDDAIMQRKKWELEYYGNFAASTSRINDGVYDRIYADIRSKKAPIRFENPKLQKRYYFTDDEDNNETKD